MTIGVQQLMLEVERVRDAFHAAVHGAGDVEAAVALTSEGFVLRNLPLETGASDRDGMRRYLTQDLLPNLPSDLTFTRLSRTTDRWKVAEEITVAFTHDRELPWLLPGVAPTFRAAEVFTMSVVTVRASLITAHRTLWDHAGLCAQLRIDPAVQARVVPSTGQ